MPKLSLRLILIHLAILLCCSATPAQDISGKIVYADDPGRIQVINADGTGQTQLTAGGSIIDDDPVYSPDGSRIAFSRMNGFKTEICVMNADGTNQHAVGSALYYLRQPIAWSSDSQWVLLHGESTLELVNVQTGLVLPLSYAGSLSNASLR